jgi:hypothetical protein
VWSEAARTFAATANRAPSFDGTRRVYVRLCVDGLDVESSLELPQAEHKTEDGLFTVPSSPTIYYMEMVTCDGRTVASTAKRVGTPQLVTPPADVKCALPFGEGVEGIGLVFRATLGACGHVPLGCFP